MKKLLIASVSVLALSAGAAFAQSNTSGVYQNGNGNNAGVTQQINDGTSNTSNVYQGYYGNGDGAYNSSANVAQIGGAGGTTSSTVVQNDGYQSATVSQTGAAGSTQTSGISQSNYNNYANVQQVAVAGGTQTSNVTQSGQYNTAAVSQNGPTDNSSVTQTGYGSASYWGYGGVNVTQGGQSTNTSYVTQGSNYSGANVWQGGTGGTNWSNVGQTDGSYQGANVGQSANGAGSTRPPSSRVAATQITPAFPRLQMIRVSILPVSRRTVLATGPLRARRQAATVTTGQTSARPAAATGLTPARPLRRA